MLKSSGIQNSNSINDLSYIGYDLHIKSFNGGEDEEKFSSSLAGPRYRNAEEFYEGQKDSGNDADNYNNDAITPDNPEKPKPKDQSEGWIGDPKQEPNTANDKGGNKSPSKSK